MTHLTHTRRAYLVSLRASLLEARTWLVLTDVCDAAIVRIDALLSGTATLTPTLHDDLLAVLPRLTAILNRIERDDNAALKRGVIQCQREIERRVYGHPSQTSRQERWAQRQEMVET